MDYFQVFFACKYSRIVQSKMIPYIKVGMGGRAGLGQWRDGLGGAFLQLKQWLDRGRAKYLVYNKEYFILSTAQVGMGGRADVEQRKAGRGVRETRLD